MKATMNYACPMRWKNTPCFVCSQVPMLSQSLVHISIITVFLTSTFYTYIQWFDKTYFSGSMSPNLSWVSRAKKTQGSFSAVRMWHGQTNHCKKKQKKERSANDEKDQFDNKKISVLPCHPITWQCLTLANHPLWCSFECTGRFLMFLGTYPCTWS